MSKKKYYVLNTGFGEGCDNTIGCNYNFHEVAGNPKNMKEAKEIVAAMSIDSYYTSVRDWVKERIETGEADAEDFDRWIVETDHGISSAIIIEVANEYVLPFEEVEDMVHEAAKPFIEAQEKIDKKDQEKEERAQLARLKKKYEKV